MKYKTTLLIVASLMIGFAALFQNSQLQQNQIEIHEKIKAESLLDQAGNTDFYPNFKSAFGLNEDFGDAPEMDWLKKFDGLGTDKVRKVVPPW